MEDKISDSEKMGAGPADTLESLLVERAVRRSTMSSQISVAVTSCTLVLMIVELWSAISLDHSGQSTTIYGLFAIFALVFVVSLALSIYTCKTNAKVVSSEVGYAVVVRTWHKKAYKFLVGLVVVEHCLFFCSLPVMLYHSLGLSLSECLTQRSCYGMNYSTWVTVSSRSNVRTQELQSLPVYVYLTNSALAMFGGYIVTLVAGLIVVGLYLFTESRRRESLKSPLSISSLPNRLKLIQGMALTTVTQLIFSIVGLCTMLTNWFVISLVLALVSGYPVHRLWKGLPTEKSTTRLQFRKISQICISLLFLYLYCSGAGIATSLISNSPYHSEETGFIMGGSAVAQLALLIVFHVLFSVLSSLGIYLHLSVTDMMSSILKTSELSKKVSDEPTQGAPVVVEDGAVCQTADHAAVMDWGHRLCAACSSHETNTVLVPCGHSVICKECSEVLLTIPGFKCPLCCMEVFDCHNTH